ncbi:hypothetical protein [Vibrio quintilis]|uniref:Uncharacterized protein n=1 Tax=Vibrio quintilis TaxID=1117707 RepID=A0A1M7YPI6_9VIBR|nr:hypothetical protein [Vibrio quintilis]SHO54426.1 hypothetical protein VQ7734_00140 [Vibrio quintilis]
MDKKWVFKQLVKDKSDIEGLIAYALYKYQKDQTATQLREKEGEPEEVISERLKLFHDGVLLSEDRLNSFRESAFVLIDQVTKSIQHNLEKEYQIKEAQRQAKHNTLTRNLEQKEKSLTKRENDIDSQIEKGIENRLKSYVTDAAEYVNKKSKVQKFASWLIGGFSGYAAGLILIIFVWGIIACYSNDAVSQHAMVENCIHKILDFFTTRPI